MAPGSEIVVSSDRSVLVLGLGNILLSDDGVGVHVVRRLEDVDDVVCRDGGTLGLALLPEIEAARGLIVVDAARFGEAPGAVRVFEGAEFDARLGVSRASVHELALADLMDAARLTGSGLANRALVGIEPESIAWGITPTAAVAAAAPAALRAVRDIIERWRS
ncbi:MAG: hydrogenase maturation protease [Roseiarcus sp.]